MEKETAIKKYEDLLLGTNTHFYMSGSDAEKEQAALTILRYIITDLLGWTPQEAMEGIPQHIAEQMHIPKLMVYIQYPRDIDEKTDYDYAVYKAFPDEVTYDARKKIIRLYRKVLSGDKNKFPKNYFNEGKGGRFRAKTILVHAIDTNLTIKQKELPELYKIFNDEETAKKLLKEWRLLSVCRTLYDGNPLLYLYESLSESEEGEFLYNYYTFKHMYKNFEAKYDKMHA